MSDTSTETVSLNLDGTFTPEASKGAAAGDAFSAALEKMGAAANAYHDPKMQEASKVSAITAELNQQAAVAAKIAAFDGNRTRALAQQEALLRKMKDDATGATAHAARQKAESESNAQTTAMLERASAGLLAGGTAVLAAATALAKAAADLVVAGYKQAVETTSRHEIQNAVGNKLGAGTQAYDQTVHAALKMGIDPDAAWEQTKKLLNAKFSSAEIPALIRVKAGMDLAGLDGDALLKKLETIKLGSKVGTKDVEGLKKLGIDVGDVYKAIAAKTGESMDVVKAKVKAGTADTAQVVAAIEKVAGDKFGGLADKLGNSVPALIARVKGGFLEMFNLDPKLLDPIKDVLKNVLSVIEGPGGKAMKASVSELFASLNKSILSNFQGEAGRKKLEKFAKDAAAAIHEFAGAVTEAAPAFKLLERLLMLGSSTAGGSTPGGVMMRNLIDSLNPLSGAIADLNELEATLEALDKVTLDDVAASVENAITGALQSVYDTAAQFLGAGMQMAQGLADGITGGASAAIDAAVAMATDALAQAKAILGIASPSQEFAEVGDYSAEGMAAGMSGSSAPAAAGKKMAASALGAAGGAASGAAGAGAAAAGGAGGGMQITFNVTGSGAAASEWEALEPKVEACFRRIQRDRQEGARP